MRFKKYPAEAILRDTGEKLMLGNNGLSFVALCHNYKDNITYDIKNDTVFISPPDYLHLEDGQLLQQYHPHTSSSPLNKNENRIELRGAINNGDVVSVFLHNDYGKLPVGGKMVLDIGANIGDSPIYFALRGAQKVIALEPFAKNYDIAKHNIELNNLSDRIVLLQVGCASRGGNITLDPNHESNTISKLPSPSEHGTSITLMSLKDIIDQYNIGAGSILKMDCEGCEYDAILTASAVTLQNFSHIQIEYHYGYKDLKEKLRQSGFKVSTTIPKTDPKDVFSRPAYRKNYVGMLYAKISI
jgi:FkbM family methyltransferase